MTTPASPTTLNDIVHDEAKLTAETQRLFDKYDVEKHGTINGKELKAMLDEVSDLLGIPQPTEAEAEAVLEQFDINHDHRLNVDEFKNVVSAMLTLRVEVDESAKEAGKAA